MPIETENWNIGLIVGGSGTGKTTLARIVSKKLKCTGSDFLEMNAAKERGIDMVRNMSQRIGLAPMQSPCRVWLLDEAHALSADAQGALLKLLEDIDSLQSTLHEMMIRMEGRTFSL